MSVEHLLKAYEYRDGKFYYRDKLVGREAGFVTDRGYKALRISGKKYLQHRLVWCLLNGEIPDGLMVDHIDGDRLNNAIENLRLVTNAENSRNRRMRRTNKSGFTGVNWHSRDKVWIARTYIDGRQREVGRFSDPAEASEAVKAARSAHGYSERHGVPA